MKIGILSDIHGQLAAAQAALQLFEQQQVDTIICGGDLVDRGADGDAVVALIQRRDIACVQGNHDALAARTQAFLARHASADLPIEPLTDETVTYLDHLPRELRFAWEETSVYLAHANPWHDFTQRVRPDDLPATFQQIVQVTQAQVVVLGHSHLPMHIHYADTLIINPGSVFANYRQYPPTCGILHLPERTFQVFDILSGEPLELSIRTIEEVV